MKNKVLVKNSKINRGAIANNCSFLKGFSIAFVLSISSLSYAQTGTWAALTNKEPNENMGAMLLLTDGTVICHNATGGSQGLGTGWDKLTPTATGSYVNGTWTTLASMNQERYVFPSQVLPSGKVFVAGGEYGEGDTAGEVYDPVANKWTRTEGVVSKMNIYDGNSELLPNGNVLVGLQAGNDPSFDCQFYSPTTNKWTTAPTAPLNHDEAAWLKLPDSSILFVGIATCKSCRYRPQTNTWINDANLPDSIFDKYGEESGSAQLLPNGKAIFFGATGHNCVYTPSGTTAPGSWVRVADFPFIGGKETGMVDAPSIMLPNGHIIMAVSPIGTSTNNEFLAPTYFLEYNYLTNTFTQITSTLPGLGTDDLAGLVCQSALFLLLPDGTVLMGINQDGSESQQYYIYTESTSTSPIAADKPVINSILPDGCPYYKLTGKLFNGIGEGSGYGDDWQNYTNYPLVRLTNAAGDVYFCKTTDWNRLGAVMTDSLEDTTVFETPATLPSGTYSLVVIANGVASNPTIFSTLGETTTVNSNASCGGNGSASTIGSGGISPYTYSWTAGGGTGSTATGLNAGTYTVTITDANNCSATATVVITQSSTLGMSANATANVKCNGTTDGSATATVSGGATPYTYSWTGGKTTATINGLSAGIYTVELTDNNGCSGTASVTITQPSVLSSATYSVAATSAKGCDGEAAVTVSGGTAPYTYSWSGGAGTTDTIKNQCVGDYCCTITDNNGCVETTCVTITYIAGIVNINNTLNINIYPEPSAGLFTISGVIKGQVIELYNILGQQLNRITADKATMYFNIVNQADGIYLVRILNRDGSLVTQKKIVKAQ